VNPLASHVPYLPRAPRPPSSLLRRLRRLALLGFLALPAFLSGTLTGCLTEDADNTTDTTKNIDPFPDPKPDPKPTGPRIIPLTKAFQSRFAFARFDSTGNRLAGPDTLVLYVSKRPNDLWTYAFDDSTQGFLLRYVETPNRDSAGVWIVGSYGGGRDTLDSIPTLWLPQKPDTGRVWNVGRGRKMRLDDSSSSYYTEALLSTYNPSAATGQGFQKHTALRFKETAGDTLTVYHFKDGLGCLGFERSTGGRLLAVGTLVGFSNP
jgi:hypothetical protein